jgi:crossover junction endodeoxyribonuclease RuvC
MPKQGVASTFKFGKGYGEVLGITTALHFEIHEPTPQAWKKAMLTGTDKSKDASIQVAENLFPTVSLVLPRCRKAHDGMAEALLMAEYIRRMHTNGGIPK